MITYWFLFAYTVGTAFGWYMGRTQGLRLGVGVTIDSLIDRGYLKSKITKDGVVILKIEEDNEV
jgi:hypothetical protein